MIQFSQGAAKNRVVLPEEVVAREPDLVISSWCGKKFRPERVAARPGFAQTAAVQRQDMYEIKSSFRRKHEGIFVSPR